MTLHFASTRTFLDPELTSDGKPYGPERYRQLVQERYLIVKHGHISYDDTGKMTPTERSLIMRALLEDSRREKEQLEQVRNKRKNK